MTGLVGVAASLAAAGAHAQVLQIEPDGAVTTFAGPAVFDASGARPLARPVPAAPSRVASGGRANRDDVRHAADLAALSPELIAAVAWRESRFRADAVSPKGALGVMQLMPSTARALGVDPADAGQNLKGGAAYLRVLMRRYDGDLQKTLAAYDAGPAAVDRYGGVPPFRETQAYVAAVLDRLSQVADPMATRTAQSRTVQR